MSARLPRRTFATPFVVTLACTPAATTPVQSPQPEPPQQPQAQQPQAQEPQPEPAPEPVSRPVMNPPRPQPASQYPNGTSWTVFKSDTGCQIVPDIQCPPNATCNPPRPRDYACPENVTQEAPIKIVVRAGQCELHRDVHCPPNAKCNPPPPRVVPCPD
jgi:hypothetical protein